MSLKHDPVEDTEKYKAIEAELEAKIKKQMEGYVRKRGIRSPYDKIKKEILKNEYGIEWKSRRELNPRVKFD